MHEEGALKIECAKLQSNIKLMEDDLSQLRTSLARNEATADSGRTRLVEQERRKFEDRKRSDKRIVDDGCSSMRQRVSDLLDSFPGMATKEFSGKYEIKDLEQSLEKLYPKELLDSYICSNPIQFEDESEAYSAYAYVERKVALLRDGSMSGSIFTWITGLLDRVCSDDGLVGKVSLAFIGMLMLTLVVSPFIFMTIFSVVGVSALVHGALVNTLFRDLYSVKMFLNNAYDEELFQDNKSGIMESVDAFLEQVRERYYQDIDTREFKMNPKILEDYDQQIKNQRETTQARIKQKEQQLADAQSRAAELLQKLEAATAERERLAKEARTRYLDTINWKFEWMEDLLLDVTPENRIIGCKWLRGNTLYYSKSQEHIEQFQQLAVLQGVLRMHPSYAGQVYIDSKNMGTALAPYRQLNPSIFAMYITEEDIEKRFDRMRTDIRSRVDSILQSCSSIEDFNKLMSTYGVNGESYVVVHIVGLTSFTPQLLSFLKNGPKVGYFFKIYMTTEELKAVGKDFPYADIPEYAEIGDAVVPRTAAQVRRIAEESA